MTDEPDRASTLGRSDDEGPLDDFRSKGQEVRNSEADARLFGAGIDVVGVSGEIVVSLHLTGDDSRVPAKVSVDARVTMSAPDRELWFVVPGTGEPPRPTPPTTPPSVSIEIGALDRVRSWSGATVIITGVQDDLRLEALAYGTIDASALNLRTAAVELEVSSVTISATESVTGYAAYQSELTVTGGADVSGIFTNNAGRLFIDPQC